MRRPFADKRPVGPFIDDDTIGSVRQPDSPGSNFTPPDWHTFIHDTEDLIELPLEKYPTLDFDQLTLDSSGRFAANVLPFKERNDLASKDFSQYGVVTPDNPTKEQVQISLYSKETYGKHWLTDSNVELVVPEDRRLNQGPIPTREYEYFTSQTNFPEAYTGPAISVSIESMVDTPIENVSYVANMLLKNAMLFAEENHPSHYGGDRSISQIPKGEWGVEFKKVDDPDDSVYMLITFDLITRDQAEEIHRFDVDTPFDGPSKRRGGSGGSSGSKTSDHARATETAAIF